MASAQKNKEVVIRMVNQLSGVHKDRLLLSQFIADEALIEHFLFFDSLLPANQLLIDELTAEGTRIVLRVRVRGRQEGQVESPREVEFPLVFGFEIEQHRIVHHWLVADQAKLLDQLKIQK